MFNKSLSMLRTFALIAGVATFSFACSEDDDNNNNNGNPTPKTTIADVASTDAELSTFVAVLQATGLDGLADDENANLTVFAPTNEAFGDLLDAFGVTTLQGLIDEVGADALTEIVKYHVLSTEVMSSMISDGYVTTEGMNARGEKMSMYIGTMSGVQINGGASTVEEADIDADNGVIHKVGAVILPPTIGDLAIAGPNFSSLVAAVQAADASVLTTITDADAVLTLFAPDNDAFADLIAELQVQTLADVVAAVGQDGLTDILFYHALADEITSSEVGAAAGTGIGTALAGSTIDISVGSDGSVMITDAAGRMAMVEAVDIQGSNGVIHQINKVILPN